MAELDKGREKGHPLVGPYDFYDFDFGYYTWKIVFSEKMYQKNLKKRNYHFACDNFFSSLFRLKTLP